MNQVEQRPSRYQLCHDTDVIVVKDGTIQLEDVRVVQHGENLDLLLEALHRLQIKIQGFGLRARGARE